jgi:predicted kinase
MLCRGARCEIGSAWIILFMDGSGRLIIICGLPGSGKTTLGRILQSRLRAVRFCPDEWFEVLGANLWKENLRAKIEALQWKLTQELLALGLTAIIEWGTWGRNERDELRLGARSIGAAVELHFLDAPVEVLFERLSRRGLEDPPIRMDQLAEWAQSFQSPTEEEMALFDPPLAAESESE